MNETNTSIFWETWAPYLSYVENNHLDLDCIKQLRDAISDPVLVVGAGQGLLVEELQKVGIQLTQVNLASRDRNGFSCSAPNRAWDL